ncbi:MAG TPA: DUF4838 domain-containing protein, partial [Candidatus Hydrogenedentes bacterium]|nr:DUF4838 domain-containing protein [Candidatus Hydrogenedentota bacterium]
PTPQPAPAPAPAPAPKPAPAPAPAPSAMVIPDVPIPEVPGVAAEGILLAQDGVSEYRLVIEPGASPSERLAAAEIQTHFKACTGAELPIVEGKPAEAVPMIVLGCGPTAEGLGVNPAPEDLGDQGYVLITVGKNVVIAGSAAAGTLYGARDFLKADLGVRWYAPDETRTPELKTAYARERGEQKVVQPSFEWRLTSYEWPGGDETFRARRGENNGTGGPDNELGIQYAHDGRCHTYSRFIRPEEYFDQHPEYFSEIGGKRVRDETQLCLTNPEVLELVTEKMLQRMREHPEYVQQNFSQSDYYSYCECKNCAAMNEAMGTAGGTQFWFVNQLAERTSKEFPNILIGTLAYMYTEEPPKDMRMHPNVAVWLCHMYPSCQSHPIATCEKNANFKRRAQRWAEICDHLYIWYYIVDFAHYYNPYPNFGAMAADYKFFHDIGVEGVYSQGMGHSGGGGEFSLLRPYYATEFMKDQSQDPDVVMYDFFQGYYGAAAPHIYRYAKMLQQKVDTDNIHMHLYTNPGQGYLTDEIVAAGEELFNRAEEAVAGDEKLLERVRVCRMPLVYARWFPRNGYDITEGKLVFKGTLAKPDEMTAFGERMAAHGFQNIREWGGSAEELALYSMVLNTSIPLPSIKSQHLTVDVVPFMGARALRIIHNATGECVTAYNVVQNLVFPFGGGEDTRVGGNFAIHEGGPMVQAEMTNLSDNKDAITLDMGVRGVKIERNIALAPDRPAVIFTITATNPGDKPIVTRVKSHLELDLGGLASTRLAFQNINSETVDMDMRPIIDELREGQMFHADTRTLPAGEWTFSGSKGLKVTQRFDKETVDLTWVYAYPEELQDLEVELWRIEGEIPPGQSVTLRHELEIQPAG